MGTKSLQTSKILKGLIQKLLQSKYSLRKFYSFYGGFEEKIFRNIQLQELEAAQKAQKKVSF